MREISRNPEQVTAAPAHAAPGGGPGWARWFGPYLCPALIGLLAVFAVLSVAALRPQAPRTISPELYDPYFDDFVVFYSAGWMALSGEGSAVYELSSIHRAEADVLDKPVHRVAVLPFFNAPPMLVPMTGLALFPLKVAAVIYAGLGIVSGLLAFQLALRQRSRSLGREAGVVCAVGIVASMPLYQVMIHGQISLILLLGLALVWHGGFARRSDFALSAGLGLLFLKPQLALLPIALFLASGRYRAVALFGGSMLGLSAVAAIWLGPRIYADYAALMLDASRWEEENGVSIWGMFGWNAFVYALVPEVSASQRVVVTFALTISTLFVWAVVQLNERSRTPPEHRFAALVIASILISPHLYAHDLVLVMLPVTLLLTSSTNHFTAWATWALMGWLLIYFHFDLLPHTHVNLVTLWLALGLIATSGLAWHALNRFNLPTSPFTYQKENNHGI